MSITLQGKLVLVGCGKMGGAMLEGWLKAGVEPKKIIVLQPTAKPEMVSRLASLGIGLNVALAQITDVEVVVLAVKPQKIIDVLPELSLLQKSKPLTISVAAGKSLSVLETGLGIGASIIRAMPNTPAAIGRGITGYVGNANVSTAQLALAEALLGATGEVVRVADEAAIDFVTAVSGSGPAYVFFLTECLAHAGAKLGLPSEMAMQLARATVTGAGALMEQTGIPADVLRQNVTSPNGTTYAALQVLMAEDGLKPLMEKAVAAAAARAQELAG